MSGFKNPSVYVIFTYCFFTIELCLLISLTITLHSIIFIRFCWRKLLIQRCNFNRNGH